MYVSTLTLNNFRNYEKQFIELSVGTNVFCGHNAQGKTNILEAIYMFCRGKSTRARQDTELIKFGEDFFRIEMSFNGNERDFKGVITANKLGKKAIKINNIPITKLSMLMSYFNAVFFTPEDLSLIKGSPAQRRRFIDSSLCQMYPSYLSSLVSYNKTLLQKNFLLKNMRSKHVYSDPTLDVWNEALAKEGAKVAKYRIDFIENINNIAADIQSDISGEKLKVYYQPGINSEPDEQAYYNYLQEHIRREVDNGSAQYGVQRDDIGIFINDNVARQYCSQGQQRTAALALKIAQGDYIKELKNEYPVYLLDDIMSELDINRRRYLWERIKGKQVIITCTDTDEIETPENSRLFYVENGAVKGAGI